MNMCWSREWISNVFLHQFSSHAVMLVILLLLCGLSEVHYSFLNFFFLQFFFSPYSEMLCFVPQFWKVLKRFKTKNYCTFMVSERFISECYYKKEKQSFVLVIINLNAMTLPWNNFPCPMTSLRPCWLLYILINSQITIQAVFIANSHSAWLHSDI